MSPPTIRDDPDIATLRSIAASITATIDEYEYAGNANAKAAALRSISRRASTLQRASLSAQDAFQDFTFRPLANACVRIAISIGLFDVLPQDRAGSDIEELAKLTQTNKDLLTRVLRGLVAFDVVHLDDKAGLYRHTAMSLVYADKSQCSWAIWLWDVMIASAAGGIGPFFDKCPRPVISPSVPGHSPFSTHHDAEGMNIFEILQKNGKVPLMNKAMSGSSLISTKQAVAAYDFGSLQPGADGVTLVDVGGAKGQTIQEIRNVYPGIQGRVILQDLQSVLDDGTVSGLEAEVMLYDFFQQEQPVKGASAYLYQRIFHDWSDDQAEKILDSLKPAMTPLSKLLICDMVVQDQSPHPRNVLRDLNMLIIGGLERSQRQWTALLKDKGFVIERIHGLDSPDNSIIEARLAA